MEFQLFFNKRNALATAAYVPGYQQGPCPLAESIYTQSRSQHAGIPSKPMSCL